MNLGGVEYLALWAGGSLVYAVQAWKQELASTGGFHILNPA